VGSEKPEIKKSITTSRLPVETPAWEVDGLKIGFTDQRSSVKSSRLLYSPAVAFLVQQAPEQSVETRSDSGKNRLRRGKLTCIDRATTDLTPGGIFSFSCWTTW